MVARDPIRKVTLDPRNPKKDKDGQTVGSNDPHVGSTVNVGPPVSVKQTGTVSGRSSADPQPEKSKKKD